jgi:parallel beta-helix repeat protein
LRIEEEAREMKQENLAAVLLAAVAMLTFAASAGAVDGTIEINQAKVMASGGFPYVISAANTSYRLTGSLAVPVGIDGIDVNATNVTIDLNGFSIKAPGNPGINVTGINASAQSDVTVENGTATGFAVGIQVGSAGIVRNMHADANGVGMTVGNNTVVTGCTANNSSIFGAWGINCSGGCSISGNTANGNNFFGIECSGQGCLISGNTADGNGNTGIFANDTTTGYGGNVLINNADGNVSGGTSMKNNVCQTSGVGIVC